MSTYRLPRGYAYDHTGQRTLKMTGDASTVDLNAQLQQIVSGLNRVTIYPSPYLVLTEQGYTKHYYAGADRVCARLGSGGLDHDTACISRNEEVSNRVENLFWHGLKLVDAKEFKPESLKELQLVDIHGKELDWLEKVDIKKLLLRLRISVKPDPWNIHHVIDNLVRERPDDEPGVYFYHSDHLGGASWITDGSGIPVQHLQYLPFGEPFVDQHPAGYQERFRFTGKERDEETGYGYFGARYMDHELMTMWLSVDPMADKYPDISPYAYCAWNPVKLVDPDGREFGDFYGKRGQYLGNDGKNDGMVYVMRNGRDALCGTWDLFIAKLKVQLHRGNSEYFDEHPEIYDNFISILPLDMLAEAYGAIQDNGTGGSGDDNNREYGGYANTEGTTWEKLDVRSEVGNPHEGDISIPGLKYDRIRFHSHPSGTRSTGNPNDIEYAGATFSASKRGETHSWVQTPSTADINRAGNTINYVFGMRDKTLSVYDKNGIQATIPLSRTDLGDRLGVK